MAIYPLHAKVCREVLGASTYDMTEYGEILINTAHILWAQPIYENGRDGKVVLKCYLPDGFFVLLDDPASLRKWMTTDHDVYHLWELLSRYVPAGTAAE